MTESQDTAPLQVIERNQLFNNAEAQLITLLFEWIGEDDPDWLSPETQRVLWPTEVRFAWLEDRPDVRARVVHELVGVSEAAAALLEPEMQLALVDAVVDAGDTPVELWCDAWEPSEMGAHAPPGAVHAKVRECFPWQAPPTKGRKAFLTRWLEALLSAGDGNGRSREPILSPLMFRSAIDTKAWQESLPLTIRATIDAARLRAEWKERPFTAEHELAMVTIETVTDHLPVYTLQAVLEAAEKTLRAPPPAADLVAVAEAEAEDEDEDEMVELVEDESEATSPATPRPDRTEEVPRA